MLKLLVKPVEAMLAAALPIVIFFPSSHDLKVYAIPFIVFALFLMYQIEQFARLNMCKLSNREANNLRILSSFAALILFAAGNHVTISILVAAFFVINLIAIEAAKENR